MIRYIIRRLWQMVPTVFGVIIITFILFNIVGGSPGAMALGKKVSPQQLEDFDERRGFNKPLLFGWWTETRACSDSSFDMNAGVWSQIEGVEYQVREGDDPGILVVEPESEIDLPLAFSLYTNTTYRWSFQVRMLTGGRVQLVEGGTEVLIPPGEAWQHIELPFEVSAAAPSAGTRLRIDGAPMEMRSTKLRRKVSNPFDSQLAFYLGQVARFDFGESHDTNQRVSRMILDGLWPSVTLTLPILFLGVLVSISMSLLCAFYRDTLIDRSFVVIAVVLMSVNYLVWIVVGQYVLAYRMALFPVWGYESAVFLGLPVLIGAVNSLGGELRLYRTIMLDEMYKDYVRTAFAKGVSKPAVLFKHVLKNAMIPISTNLVIAIAFLYTGSLLLEHFFGIPGLGYIFINAYHSSDIDVIRAIVLIGSVTFVLANLATDLFYAFIDPRVKLR